ncbi:glycine/betaine ABC transporter substrate-binding protein [Actinomycetospora sp. NBRC 106375]|uniref:glycine betaine ABC transporter substrate-binding protein n=1 Tax=Actinomycetospora sp. NBRC 106375 TaxID=3032207 RepID=UPI0024A3A82F|nr:glycine betaine ABC transporter substrate-binding protein [Actinomycetospora sp. NBRC 106375]GLZ45545.1 glycine/betaine ABC transporter substrate-binding protein [Actinomycetospora sp. NBRC 106375]
MHTRTTGRVAGAIIVVLAFVLAGCGGLSGTGQPQASGGSLAASGINLQGQTYTVGGQEFDEQLLLCKMSVAALQSVGATVNDRCNITGSAAARQALLSGEIDMGWSYTGTGWITNLQNTTPIPDSQQQYVAVRDQDLQRNQIVWTNPTPFNNTYAIATTRAFADQNNLRTTTDWANFINSGNPQATTCVEAEFASRNDGLPNLLKAYGVTVPYSSPPALTVLDTGAIYQATANGDPCKFGEVFTTDGRIPALNLVSLTDDKNFFPKYNASNTIRKQVVDRNPRVVDVFNQISPALTDDVMLQLNGQVSSQGADPAQVATQFLQQRGFIGQ